MRKLLFTFVLLIVTSLSIALYSQICATPENLSVTGLSRTQATLLWDLPATGDVPTSYFFRLSSGGTVISTDSNLVAPSQSHIMTNLTANTTYLVELSSTCNASGSGISDIVTFTFTTPCPVQSAPYTENFNTAMPSCTFSENAAWSNGGRTGKCMALTTTAAQAAYIVFPELNLSSDNVEASFWLKASTVLGGNIPFHIGIITDPSDIASSFEPLFSSTLTNTSWTEFRMNTSATTQPLTSSTMIAVSVPQGYDCTVYLDDAAIHAIPTCIRPEDFAVTNVTATSATFSWTTTNATQTRIYITSATDTRTVVASANPYTLSSLLPNTDYTFQIRALCSSVDSSELNPYPLSIRTECVTADSAIFVQTFDQLTVPNSLPDCWKEGWFVKPSGNTRVFPFAATTDRAHSGTRSMAFLQQTDGSVAYLTTQALPLDQSGAYTLSVWVYRQEVSDAQTEGLRFWASPDPYDTTGATLLGYIPRHYQAAPVEHTANQWYNYQFVINTSGTQYIIVEGISQNAASVCFDDLAVIHTPTCFRVSNVQFGAPTSNSIGMTWTPGMNGQQWIVSYSLNDGPYVTDTVTSPAYTIAGLTSATSYAVEGTVTSLCGTSDLSEPVSFNNSFVTVCEPLSFLPYSCGFETEELASTVNPLPLCWTRLNDATGADNTHPQAATSSAYAHSGTGYLKFMPVTSTTDYGEHQVAVLPALNTTLYPINTLRLVFYAAATIINPAPTIKVGVMTDPTDLSTFTPLDSFTIGTTTHLRYEARFASYTGTGTYIALLAPRVQVAFMSLNVDDIRLEPVPACADLDGVGVNVTDITDTYATVNVTDQTATTWSYAYGVAGTPLSACTVVDTMSGTFFVLNNLTPQTSYVIYARRRCGTAFGSWSGAVTFRTACGAAQTPFSDNFETYPLSQLTGCYTVTSGDEYLNVFSDNTSASGTYNHTTGGSKGLSISYNASSSAQYPTTSDVTLTNYIHLEAGRNYEISVYARAANNSGNYQLSFVAGLSNSTLNTLTTSDVSTSSWRIYNAYFAPVSTGDYYIGVRTSAAVLGSQYVPFLDDIAVHEVSCVPPSSTYVGTLGSTTATVGFNAVYGSMWDVAVSSSPITVPGSVVGNIYRDTISNNSFTVSGLAVNTTYYYTIRTICGEGEASDWMTPQSFHTRCTTVNVPYTEGFESLASVTCWSPLGGQGSVSRETSIRHMGTSSMRASAVIAVSPEFNVTSLAPYMLDGWVYSQTDSVTVTVGVMTDPDDASSYTDLTEVVVSPANTWVELRSYFNLLNDPDYYDFCDARYIVLSTATNTVLFDDFNVNYAPDCASPTQGVVSSITGRSVTVDWTENGTATTWRVYAVDNNDVEVSQVVTTHPYTLAGLQPATAYSLYVRSICSSTDTSLAYKVGEFTTTCDYVTAPYMETFESFSVSQTPQCWDISSSDVTSTYRNHPDYIWGVYSTGGNKSIRQYNAMTSSGDAAIITPEIILPAGGNYAFCYDYCHQANSGSLYVEIRRHGQSSFTPLTSHQSNGRTDASTPWAFINSSVGLQGYAGDTVQFRFSNMANWNSGSIWVDNVRVRVLSDCSEIMRLTVQDVTANSVILAFTDTASSHTSWQYAAVLHGHDVSEAAPVTVTTKMFTVPGLNPSTNYDIYVRAVCPSDYSTWEMVTQKTLAVPATLPYITDFSNSAQNNDWHHVGGGANDFVFGTDLNALFTTGSHAMYVSTGTSYTYNINSATITAVARLFSFDESTYSFEFDWRCPGGEGRCDFARFYLAPASSDILPYYTSAQTYIYYVWPDNMIPLDEGDAINLVEGTQHLSKTIDMTGRAGEYYLVFLWANDGNGGTAAYPLSVGNLTVSELTCQPVVNLAVDANSISHTSATATFNNPNPGSDVRWAVSTSQLINDSVASGVTQAETVVLSGLSPSTVYTLFVRSECSATDRSPWTTVTFQTECASVTGFPYFESFEGTTFPPVCWTNTSLGSVTSSFGTQYCYWEQSTRNTHSGSKSATISTINGTAALLATPAFDLDPNREYHVSFWLMQSSSTWNDDELDLYVGTDPSSTNGATLLAHYVIYNSSSSSTGLVKFDVDLPAGLSGDHYILFKGTDVSNGYVYLDDITVDIYPPCRNLTTLPEVVATTSTTASLSIAVGARTSVKYGIAPYSVSPQPSQIVSVQSSTTGDVTFTGLTPGASYSVYVRGYCSDGDSTSWTTPVTVTTKTDDCFAPENFHVVGSVSDVAATIAWNVVPDVTSYQCILGTDTSYVTSPQVSYTALTPNTDYTLMVRGFCGAADTTQWSNMPFRTLCTPATLPYVTGFEPSDDNSLWQRHVSSFSNNFVVGHDAQAHSSGTRGLYISSDGRAYSQTLPANSSYQYGVNVYGVSYYSRTIYFPAAGNYEISFDWKCDPVAGLSYEAYGRAFVAPATATLPVDDDEYLRNLPDGSFAIGTNLENSPTWQHTSSIFTIDAPQYMNLVFMYISVNVNGYASADHVSDTPLAVDNVSVNQVTCLPVNSVVALSVADTVATVLVTQPEPVAIQYALMTDYSLDSLNIVTLSNTTLRDTLTFAGLTPATDYYLVARQRCSAADSSSWKVLSFRTTAVSAPLPYVCDFEDDTENANWAYTQAQGNYFTIGTSTSYGGTHSLYVTNDGSSYNYDNSVLSFAYAHRIISLPAGLYEYSYDWLCNGESNDDGARLFLIPADVLLFPDSWLYGLSYTTVPKNAIALDNGLLYGSASYSSHSGSFTIPEDKLYNIVLAWRNGSSGGSNPPISLDNLSIRAVTCLPPTLSLVADSLGENSASVAVSNVNQGSSLVYALSPTSDIADAVLYDTLPYAALDTINLTGLSASSTYYIHVRALCSADDRSFWSTLQFKTLCGVVSLYPYTQNFDALNASNGYVASVAQSICWSALNAVSAKPNYNISSVNHSDGTNSLCLNSSSVVPLYMLLPEMDDVNNLYLTFTSMYDATTADAGTLSVGYLTDPADGDSFVSVQDITRTTSWSAASVIFSNVPAGARMAFRYSGANSNSHKVYIDAVRVTHLVDGPVYNDTVCNTTNYIRHGFNVSYSKLTIGDNTLTRIAAGATEGAPDSLIIAYVHRLPNLVSQSYDTTCAGQPYTRGLWNIAAPVTRTYRNTFRGASVCGCDSTVQLYLTVIPTSAVTVDTVCHGGSYSFGDTLITDPGMYTRTYLNTYGCTCNDTLYLMVLPDSVFDVATVCQNNLPYLWRGQSITTAGRHTLSVVGPRSCQQTAVLDLTVLSTDSSISVSFCQGGFAPVLDTVIATAGTHIIQRLDSVGGCIITYTVTATVTSTLPVDVYDYACQGYPYTGNGIIGLTVTSDTVVIVTGRTTDSRCDSVTNVHIAYVPSVFTDIYDTIANGEIYHFNGNDYTKSGVYTAQLRTLLTNCDSTVTLHLTVLGTSAVDVVSDITIDVVPNPVSAGATAFVHGDISDVVKVEIINTAGLVVHTFVPSSCPIQIPGLNTAGLYHIRLTTSSGDRYLRKLIVR